MTSVFPEGQTLLRQIREISLNKLKSNDYYVEITLTGRRGRQIDRVSEKFNLYWHPRAMVLNDFETAVSQLKYIARSDEIKKLKDASTPEERVEKWEGFWTSHDPSPGTPENELQRDYYNRIAFANLNFGILKKEGWRTDRGMIFIQYGFPDQIEDFPFELDSKAYQIWYYYQPVSSFDEPSSEPRKFIFVDDWGDGDFRLQYPYDGRRW
nr:GWxTD domain-containing protein [candidate division Zixibacteria bacterium]